MKLVAGIDIGNATTETALARIEDGHAVFLASGTVPTTGIKGDPPEHQRHLSLPDQRFGEGRAGAQGAVGGAPE